MPKGKVTLSVFSPRGVVESIPQVSASPRLADLTGAKIGIINNGKSGGEMLLPYLEEALRERIGGVELRTWRIPFAWSADTKESRLKEVSEYGDGVIALMGD